MKNMKIHYIMIAGIMSVSGYLYSMEPCNNTNEPEEEFEEVIMQDEDDVTNEPTNTRKYRVPKVAEHIDNSTVKNMYFADQLHVQDAPEPDYKLRELQHQKKQIQIITQKKMLTAQTENLERQKKEHAEDRKIFMEENQKTIARNDEIHRIELNQVRIKSKLIDMALMHGTKGIFESGGSLIGQYAASNVIHLLELAGNKGVDLARYSTKELYRGYCKIRGLPEPQEPEYELSLEEQRQVAEFMQKQKQAHQNALQAKFKEYAQRGKRLDDVTAKIERIKDALPGKEFQEFQKFSRGVIVAECAEVLQTIEGLQEMFQQEVARETAKAERAVRAQREARNAARREARKKEEQQNAASNPTPPQQEPNAPSSDAPGLTLSTIQP
jgi:hypothetical protein